MSEATPMQQYYAGKTVFITGASGFMGKVLLEKLLYSCHGIKEIIIVVRPKRGKVPETRMEEMFKLPMFQRIRDEKPEVLKKITCYQGDVTFDTLGLSGDALKHVLNNTNIVFHLAATLKLEGNLKDAINFNLSGTRRTLDLAKQMKHLEAFVHLSTAFCNCDQEVMYEKVYEFPHKPEDLMRLAEWMDVRTLDTITPDLLKPHPNTYTYSKRLAEILVRDHYDTMPVMIARPSIVSPSAYEPVPGWVDNLNGPTGLMVGAGKGVIRSMLIDERHKSEVIPVDYAINGLVVIPYEFNSNSRPVDIPVYNVTCAEHRKVQWGEVIALSKKIGYEYPMETGLWYPDGTITTNRFHHRINVILFHWLPAYFIDFILFLCGQKRFMVRVQTRVQIGLQVLQFFTMHAWSFKSQNYESLWQKLNDEDKKNFNMNMNTKENIEEYMVSCIQGGRQYLMKESPDSLPKARKQLKLCIIYKGMVRLFRFMLNLLPYLELLKNTILSQVTPALEEPLPGWVDNMNGPTGVLIGAGKGVIRSMLCNGDLNSEIIPVDTAINGLIILPFYYKGLKEKPKQIPVLNITVPDSKKHTWKWVIETGRTLYEQYPFAVALWYPDGCITTNKIYHYFNVICSMWLPALFIDCLLTIFGQRRFMIRVQKRIAVGLEVLQFFTTRQWDFKNNNFQELENILTKDERKIFRINVDNVDETQYLTNSLLGGRQYVAKDPLSTIPRARKQMKIMYVLDRVCKILFIGFFVYWIMSKFHIIEFLTEA